MNNVWKKIKNGSFQWLETHIDYVSYLRIKEWYRKFSSLNKATNYDHAYIQSSANSKEKYFIVRWSYPSMGLMAVVRCFLIAIPWIEKQGFVPLVDWEYTDDLVNGKLGENNFWDAVFEQPDIRVGENKFVIVGKLDKLEKICLDYWDKNIGIERSIICMEGGRGREYYKNMHALAYRYLHVRASIVEEVDKEYSELFENNHSVLAVMIREQFTKSERDKIVDEAHKEMLKIHPIFPSIEKSINIVEEYMKKWNCKCIFLSATREDTIILFKQRFGECVKYFKRDRKSEALMNVLSGNFGGKSYYSLSAEEIKKYLTYDEGNMRHVAYMKEIIGASKCDYFVGAPSNGAWGALVMNGGKYKDFCFLPDENPRSAYSFREGV